MLVDRDFIYAMTGFPHPNIVKKILEELMSSHSVTECYLNISKMMKQSGISLASVIKNITEALLTLQANPAMKGDLLIKMAEIEQNLSLGCLDTRQLGGLVGAFFEVRFVEAN